MHDIINEILKTNSNTSFVTEGFARMHIGYDTLSTEFRAPYIQYAYVETDQKYIDIDFPVIIFSKKIFRPRVKDGVRGLNWEFYAQSCCPTN